MIDTQHKFTMNVARLLLKAELLGFQVTLGDAYRDPRVFGAVGEFKGYGATKSFHKTRLAIDINLFKDGVFMSQTSDHAVLGAWWESIGGTWGGNFTKADGNHYSWGEKV